MFLLYLLTKHYLFFPLFSFIVDGSLGISLECATFVETKKHDYMDFVAVYNWFVGMLSDPMTAYLLIVGLMAIESSFIPFPSEIIVPPAAYFAVVDQNISIYMVVVLATIGAILGALVNYGLSVWLGRPIVYKFANSRLGHICLIDQAKVEKAEKYFDEHGAISTLIGRLIPAVRQLISIPAGLARMNIGKFVIFTGLGALIWNAVLAGLGAWLTTFVTKDELYYNIEKYNHYLSYFGYALLGVIVIFIVFQLVKKKK